MQHNHRLRYLGFVYLLITMGASSLACGGTSPFLVEGRPPAGAYLSESLDAIPSDVIDVPMIPELVGVLGAIDTRSFPILRRGVSRTPVEPDRLAGLTPMAVLHIYRMRVDVALLIYRIPTEDDPNLMALQASDDPTKVWQIDGKVFDKVGILIPDAKKQPAQTALDPPLDRFELAHPYTPSEIVLDRKTIRMRLKANFPKLSRTIDQENYRVRLPKDHNAGFPAGVLVWISPTPDGRIPRLFFPMLDELGLIAIGVDNNGNERPITDRLQNHLDSIETLAEATLIDRNRIYLTGMSGGGKCSSMLQIAFPDVFAGAVPIVGLTTYHKAPTGDRGRHWPAAIGKPALRWMRQLKERRIAGITGTADFNEPEMSVRKRLLVLDGINARLDVIEGMAHTLPTAEQFGDALKWVDEPTRDAMIEDFRAAKETLGEYTDAYGDALGTTIAQRKMLVKVLTLAPYTEPAWEAAALLGYQQPSD